MCILEMVGMTVVSSAPIERGTTQRFSPAQSTLRTHSSTSNISEVYRQGAINASRAKMAFPRENQAPLTYDEMGKGIYPFLLSLSFVVS